MSAYRGWRYTVFAVSIVLAVLATSTVAVVATSTVPVVVAHLLVVARAAASEPTPAPTSPTASTASHPAEASERCPTTDNAAITVDVRNVSNVDGRAERVLDFLKKCGFTPGGTRDNRPQRSVVWHAAHEEHAGRRVADALGGRLPVEPDSNLPAGTVRVFLGEDYQGPGE